MSGGGCRSYKALAALDDECVRSPISVVITAAMKAAGWLAFSQAVWYVSTA
jgi:hypothetical protein